jgi:bacterioferritin (cytochrome b1)
MDILKNEVFSKEVLIGNLTIEYSVIEKDGCRVTFTAKDEEHRRIWRTELTDEDGHVKVYSSVQEAINDANRKLKSISVLKDSFSNSFSSPPKNSGRKS